jgi:hypothetical protein
VEKLTSLPFLNKNLRFLFENRLSRKWGEEFLLLKNKNVVERKGKTKGTGG